MAFKAPLFRYPGPGGWTFARIPDRHAPPVTHGWGRTPVLARVDGTEWETSVWRDKAHGTLLPVPRHVRQGKGDGDFVRVELSERSAPFEPRQPRHSFGGAVQPGSLRSSSGRGRAGRRSTKAT